MKPIHFLVSRGQLARAQRKLATTSARRSVAQSLETTGPAVLYLEVLRRLIAEIESELLSQGRADSVRMDAPPREDVRGLLKLEEVRRRVRVSVTPQTVGERLQDTQRATVRHVDRALNRVLGLDVATIAQTRGIDLTLFIDRNVNLIHGMTDDLIASIGVEVDRAFSSGLRHEELARIVRERADVSRSRAALIARDQVLTLAAQTNRARQQQLGITHGIWTTMRDERVRDVHADLDGERFSWSEGAETSDGRRIMPGEDIQCRCQGVPDLDDLLGPS